MLRHEWVKGRALPIFFGIAAIAVLVGVFSFDSVITPDSPDSDVLYSDTWNSQDGGLVESAAAPGKSPYMGSGGGKISQSASAPLADSAPMSESSSIGFAVGGAQDIDNFRKNIENNFLPLYTDITYEGLFYDYYFDTGSTQQCEKLFCPSYSSAISKDPFSEADEYYLSVGLNSGIKESDFARKKLNLVIVLDVSGSMSSPFDRYHYDQYGNQIMRDSAGDYTKSKMQIANESIADLLDHLTRDDRLGVVLFNGGAHLAKPLESMATTDRNSLKNHIMEIYANGGTNMASGISLGTSLFDEASESDQREYENRIIFLTDAMPNTGETRKGGIFDMIADNAEQNIYTTVIGVGVDFNTELVEHITKVRGANYYSVHSSSDFRERMVDEFEFMVTPLVFDLTLDLESDGYRIKNVYGSPESAQATGQIMKINTLFPSKVSDGQTRGGIVLIKLERISDDATLRLSTSYENRVGQHDGSTVTVSFDDGANYYENTGIHKGVLLTRYAELMKTWAYDERNFLTHGAVLETDFLYDDGIHVPEYVGVPLGHWERQSVPLSVSEPYRDTIIEFNEYFQEQLLEIGDFELLQEVTLMQKLESFV